MAAAAVPLPLLKAAAVAVAVAAAAAATAAVVPAGGRWRGGPAGAADVRHPPGAHLRTDQRTGGGAPLSSDAPEVLKIDHLSGRPPRRRLPQRADSDLAALLGWRRSGLSQVLTLTQTL